MKPIYTTLANYNQYQQVTSNTVLSCPELSFSVDNDQQHTLVEPFFTKKDTRDRDSKKKNPVLPTRSCSCSMH